MTCFEKFRLEHPEEAVHGCPHHYRYLWKPKNCMEISCRKCWNREIDEKVKEE